MKSLYVALVNAIGRRSLIVVFFFFGIITVLDSAHEFGFISSCLMILFNAHLKICVHCSSVPNILKISGFIPSGPRDFFDSLYLLFHILYSYFWFFRVSSDADSSCAIEVFM